jgi:hypothetical protein
MIKGLSALAEEKVLNFALSSLREYETVKVIIRTEKVSEASPLHYSCRLREVPRGEPRKV